MHVFWINVLRPHATGAGFVKTAYDVVAGDNSSKPLNVVKLR